MNVFAAFDGHSGGRIALDVMGITPGKYYASEIDKYAIQASMACYPDTIQMGSITEWRTWGVDWSTIDLLIGGSPCQGFSMAGKMAGTSAILNGENVIVDTREKYLELKEAGAEFLSQSYLFWEYILLLDHIKAANPKLKFFLENVKMKKEFLSLITDAIGVEPVLINSALVSAQNRNRYYWANWDFWQPEDKGLLLKDILSSGVVDGDKAHCLDANYYKGGNLKSYFEKHRRQLVFESNNGKKVTISQNDIYEPKSFYEARTDFGKDERKRLSALHGRDTSPRCKKSKHYIPHKHSKGNCLVTVDSFLNWIIDKDYFCRKLTIRECGRLQTIPEPILDTILNCGVSNTQLYKMFGNGWNIATIVHIFSSMDLPAKEKTTQFDLFAEATA